MQHSYRTKTFKSRRFLLSYKMEITKISSKGQIVIPQKIRNELNIDEGSIVAIEKIKDMVIIKKIDIDLVNKFKEGLEDLKSGRVRRVA
ncbi:MAG: AbrB/MazE/SpoVT family DNA-binding domain-containing protein [Candidatus Omnitrophota bacterium]